MKNIPSSINTIRYIFVVVGILPYAACLWLMKANHYELNYFWAAIVMGGCYLMMVARPILLVPRWLRESPKGVQRRIATNVFATVLIVVVLLGVNSFLYVISKSYIILVTIALTIAIIETTALLGVTAYKQKNIKGITGLPCGTISFSLLLVMYLHVILMYKLS